MQAIVTKHAMEIEFHCLKMQYEHLHIHPPKALEKLTTSIEHYGQLVPVVVVPEAEHEWTLIDGYQRVKALKRLGKDTVEAEVWPYTLPDAFIMLLKGASPHCSGILEEALVLHELYTQHKLSQKTLATRMGRDRSWISRRISLVEDLSESVLDGISNGSLSLWVGSRILAPLARATPAHATRLLNHLLTHTHSTREVASFYEHYQKSNQQERTRMVDSPELFFKAQRFLEDEKQAKVLKEGPEGQWRVQCRALTTLLSDLMVLAPQIFFRQTQEASGPSLQELKQATLTFEKLTTTIQELAPC